MSVVEQLFQCTEQFYQHVASEVPNEDRETYINRIERFLEERERLIARLPSTFQTEERRMGAQIVNMNQKIDAGLADIFAMVKNDVTEMRKKKTTTRQYRHPYEGMSVDGMFLDQRK